MKRLITAKDIARRDNMISVGAWIRSASGRQVQLKRIPVAWDGRSINGDPVEAFVDTGRVLARCPICGRHEYVDPDEPIFYCTTCGNGGSVAARPVVFPDDWTDIQAALLVREIVPGYGRNEIETVLHSQPVGLPIAWQPGTLAADLEQENMTWAMPAPAVNEEMAIDVQSDRLPDEQTIDDVPGDLLLDEGGGI